MSKVDMLKKQMRANAASSRANRASASPYTNEIEEMIQEMVKEPEPSSETFTENPIEQVIDTAPDIMQKPVEDTAESTVESSQSLQAVDVQEKINESKDSSSTENLEASEILENVDSGNDTIKSDETREVPVQTATQVTDRILTIKPYKSTELISWGALLSEEASDTLSYYAALHSLNAYIVVNSIISSEMEWESAHPEFPTKEFVMHNIKSKRNREVTKISRSLTITEEHRNFVKTASIRCGMKMQEFMEFLIMEYLSDNE